SGWDPTNNLRFAWGVSILRAGNATLADPTASDVDAAKFWCLGAEKNTTTLGFCIHATPKTKRRIEVGDVVNFFFRYIDLTSASFLSVLQFDYYARAR